jgi:hypothetical protein
VYFVKKSTVGISLVVKAVAKQKRGQPSKQGSAIPISQGVDEGTWWLGRVQKMKKKIKLTWGVSR